jgi:hypothetical protein
MNEDRKWPVAGDEVIFTGVGYTWLKNIIKNAEDNLVVGEKYTLSSVTVLSSWCSVKLKETGDAVYSLSFFKHITKNADTEQTGSNSRDDV